MTSSATASVSGRSKATAIGFIAVLLWALLALLTALSGTVPPFQLVAMSFSVAFVIGVGAAAVQGVNLFRIEGMSVTSFALGLAGLFGFHFFYFLALRNAPALEASLIIYLWPLLIVLFSTLLPARTGVGGLQWWHVAGAVLGLAGAVLILISKESSSTVQASWLGYGAAVTAALLWSSYSVLSRLFAHVPTHAITWVCGACVVGAVAAHIGFEQTVWPRGGVAWLAILGLGIGPVGGAFYLWDYGVKHGDLRVLGAIAYMAPLLSTLILVASGVSRAGFSLWLACLAITVGAALASKDLIFPDKES